MIYEFLVAGRTEPESVRKDKWDIIAVRPHPWNWGKKEIEMGLIVLVESNDLNLRERIEGVALYQNDVVYDERGYIDDELSGGKIKKNRYQIDMSKIATIEDNKLEDFNYIYQPFKKASELVLKFNGKDGNYLIKDNEVDCETTMIGKEENTIISFNNLVIDKKTGKKIK